LRDFRNGARRGLERAV